MQIFADRFRSVDEACKDNDRGAVLIIMHDGNVERFDESAFDLKALRRSDIFEVNTSKRRRDRKHGLDNLFRILRVKYNRPRINPCKLLEDERFALHNRQRAIGANVSEPEHCRAV